mgnify:CR=1 FL=1
MGHAAGVGHGVEAKEVAAEFDRPAEAGIPPGGIDRLDSPRQDPHRHFGAGIQTADAERRSGRGDESHEIAVTRGGGEGPQPPLEEMRMPRLRPDDDLGKVLGGGVIEVPLGEVLVSQRHPGWSARG